MLNSLKRFIEKLLIKHAFKKNKGKLIKPYISRGYKYISVGNNVRIHEGSRIECYPIFAGINHNPKIQFGNNVIIGKSVTIYCTDNLVIGDSTIIAHNVTIVTENHGCNPESEIPYSEQPLTSRPVSIGMNCWIGANATIVPGGGLGDNCVVAANAVVNKIFPSNVMVGGYPLGL